MKISLKKISEIIYDVTDVTLEQMRYKNNIPEFVEARMLFILTALKHGDFKKQYEITEFIDKNQSNISHAIKSRHRRDIINTLQIIEPILEEASNTNLYHITIQLNRVSNADKIILANNIIHELPAHQRQLISI